MIRNTPLPPFAPTLKRSELRYRRLTILAVIGIFLGSLSTAFAAPRKKPTPPQFVSAAVVAHNEALVCTTYSLKNKATVSLRRIDGRKLLSKTSWTSKDLKVALAQNSKVIKSLKGAASKSAKKKLKAALKQKSILTEAKLALTNCARNSTASSKVTYAHVAAIIEKDCFRCHRSIGWSDPNQSLPDFLIASGRIAPGDLESSPFYTFLSNNPERLLPASMPKGSKPLSDVHLWLLRQWILDMTPSILAPSPTPSGPEGQGRQEYNSYCASCHGLIGVSAKYGKTAAEIAAAIDGTPEMLHLRSLSPEQIERIALALKNVRPPLEGTLTVRNIGPVNEGGTGTTSALQFEILFKGNASQPFTVGYVSSNGSALAGSDFDFTSGTASFEGKDNEAKIISVRVLGDAFEEPDETLFFDIGGVSHGGVRIGTSTATGVISNDDDVTVVPPAQVQNLRLAYGFNGSYLDALGLSDAVPAGNANISTPGRVGSGALALDGSGDFITVPGTNLSGLSSVTYASWVFLDTLTQTTHRIFDFGSSTTNYLFFSPRDANNRIRFELRGTNTSTFTLQGPVNQPLATGQWIHVATVFDAANDTMKIFLNGTEVASRTGVTADGSALILTDNRIGRSRVSGSADLAGRIDEVLVWNSALNAAEIAAVMEMTQTTSINTGLEVSLGSGPIIPNNGEIVFDTLDTGKDASTSLFVLNNGPAGLGFVTTPNAQLFGADAAEFSVAVQPMPWQQLLGVGTRTSLIVRFAPTSPGIKTATLALSNNDLVSGNFAVQLRASAQGSVIVPVQPAPGQGDPTLEQGQIEYAMNCASCHGPLARSQKRLTTVAAVTAAQNPTTGVLQMKTLGLSTEQITRIVLALNTPIGESEELPMVGDSIIPVGTAPYVVESLKDIFLPPGDPATFTGGNLAVWTIITEGIFGVRTNGTFIANRVGSFSRRCQRFDTSCQSEQLLNSLRPMPDTIRAGLLKRTCDLITENDTAISNALQKIGATTASPLSPQLVKDLYEKLFVPGRTMPQYLADTIATFPNQAPQFSSTDKFRVIINYFCVSGVAEVM